ncbi:putative ankyrin repeat protein RF_0381 [Zophobas morio]|uniref:putative ankyrin repeat protein RF_0381 n=1 Tax=Zophobas morio TaxID=2755281 RepID=UPI003082B681
MGYPNLFSALVAHNTQLVHLKVDNDNLLEIAVKGTDDSVASPREGNIAVGNIILENGFDLTKDGYDTPLGDILDVACDEENYKIDLDVNLKNDEGLTALQIAAQFRVFGVVEILMKRGAEADIVDPRGNNPLHFASMLWIDNRTIIKLFIDKGVDVNVQNENGLTPLHLAWKQCNFWNTEVLLECNACVDALDEDNNSALHYINKYKYK